MADNPRRPSQREALQQVREGESFAVTMPVLGTVSLPHPQQLAYYGGLVALSVFGLLDWPVALVVAAGHVLANNHHNHVLEEIGEALEEA